MMVTTGMRILSWLGWETLTSMMVVLPMPLLLWWWSWILQSSPSKASLSSARFSKWRGRIRRSKISLFFLSSSVWFLAYRSHETRMFSAHWTTLALSNSTGTTTTGSSSSSSSSGRDETLLVSMPEDDPRRYYCGTSDHGTTGQQAIRMALESRQRQRLLRGRPSSSVASSSSSKWTLPLPQAWMGSDPSIASEWNKNATSSPHTHVIIIPTCFLVVVSDEEEAEGNTIVPNNDRLQQQLNILNQMFSSQSCCDETLPWCQQLIPGSPPSWEQYQAGKWRCSIETGIRFAWARLDPITNNWMEGETVSDINQSGACALHIRDHRYATVGFHDDAAREMKQQHRKGDARVLNVFWTTFTTDCLGMWGYSSWPFTYESGDAVIVWKEIMVGSSYSRRSLGRSLTHEVGHWLGLPHTFEGGCSSSEGILDTAAEEDAFYGCGEARGMPLGRDSCPNQPGVDPIHNFMDYGDDHCYYEFTPLQAVVMQACYEHYRVGAATITTAAATGNTTTIAASSSIIRRPSSGNDDRSGVGGNDTPQGEHPLVESGLGRFDIPVLQPRIPSLSLWLLPYQEQQYTFNTRRSAICSVSAGEGTYSWSMRWSTASRIRRGQQRQQHSQRSSSLVLWESPESLVVDENKGDMDRGRHRYSCHHLEVNGSTDCRLYRWLFFHSRIWIVIRASDTPVQNVHIDCTELGRSGYHVGFGV